MHYYRRNPCAVKHTKAMQDMLRTLNKLFYRLNLVTWHSSFLKTHGFASQPHDWFAFFQIIFNFSLHYIFFTSMFHLLI